MPKKNGKAMTEQEEQETTNQGEDLFSDEPSERDDFDAAFDEALNEGTAEFREEDKTTQTSGEQTEDVSSDAGQQSTEEQASTEDGQQTEQEASGETGDQADASTGESGEDGSGSLEEDTEKLKHKLKTLEGMYNSEIKARQDLERRVQDFEKQGAEAKEGSQGAGTAGDDGTDKEKATDEAQSGTGESADIGNLDDYEEIKNLNEDFPEIRAGLDALNTHLGKVLDSRLTTLVNGLQKVLTPIVQEHATSADEKHFSQIRTIHEDFDDLVKTGEVEEWIKTLPPTKQKLYSDIYEKGAAEEVIEVFQDYKGSTGKKQNENSGAGANGEVRAGNSHRAAESEESKRNAEALEPVRTRRGPVATGKGGAQSFDAAFDEALRE